MSTCIRNGVTYKRHWYNDEGICDLCGHLSPWAEQQREQLRLKQRLNEKIEEIHEVVNSVMGEQHDSK